MKNGFVFCIKLQCALYSKSSEVIQHHLRGAGQKNKLLFAHMIYGIAEVKLCMPWLELSCLNAHKCKWDISPSYYLTSEDL